MRVMHFHFGKDGGAERFFVHLVNALAERGVAQKAVIRPGRGWRKDIAPSVEIIESNFRNLSLDRIALPLRIAALVRSWRPDSVLGWMPKGAKLVPAVSRPRRLARLGDYPTTLKYFGNVDTIICNTPGIATHVRGMGWERGVDVISNFTSMERAAPVPRSALDTPADAFVVSSMGRFVPRKGFDVLIRALAHLPGAYLWLVGDGQEEQNLRKLAQDLGVLDRVRFAGWQADPRPFVAASDCFAMASSHEPLANVILEAWAQHVPVVSTRSEGPIWYMREGENGLLVGIGDHAGFAHAIARVRADAALGSRLAAGGAATLAERFSREAIVGAYMGVMGLIGADAGEAGQERRLASAR
jgi:glycosyltransferase involved in cell wall biosynthesis